MSEISISRNLPTFDTDADADADADADEILESFLGGIRHPADAVSGQSMADPAQEYQDADSLVYPLEGTKHIRHSFQQIFASRQEYEEYVGAYKHSSTDSSLTIHDHILLPWIKTLFEAFVNTRGVKTRDKTGYAVTRLGGQYFKPLLIHLKCWEIVVKTIKVAQFKPIIDSTHYDSEKQHIGYTKYNSWEERLREIVEVLKINKIACHMMLQPDPTDKIIQDPKGEHQEYSERNDQRSTRYTQNKLELLEAREEKKRRRLNDDEDHGDESEQDEQVACRTKRRATKKTIKQSRTPDTVNAGQQSPSEAFSPKLQLKHSPESSDEGLDANFANFNELPASAVMALQPSSQSQSLSRGGQERPLQLQDGISGGLWDHRHMANHERMAPGQDF